MPKFGKASGLTAILSRNVNEYILKPLNSLGNIRIVRQPEATEDRVVYSDGGILIALAGLANNGDAPTNVNVKRAIITAIANDYLTANQWDNDSEDFSGGSVSIVKPENLKGSIAAETIWGDSITYASYSSNYNQREATYNSQTTVQRIFPAYQVDDVIFFADTSELVGVSTFTKLDLNIEARHWRSETQGCDADTGDPIYSFVARGPWSATAIGEEFG